MTYTPYDPNVPLPNDTLDTSQVNFLDNFFSLFNSFAENHVDMEAGATAGNHTDLHFVRQPGAVLAEQGEVAVYSKEVEGQADQIVLRYQSGTEVQYTNYQIYPVKANSFQTPYFTFLPGKVVMYFGTIRVNFQNNPIHLNPNVAKKVFGVNIFPMSDANREAPFVTIPFNDASKTFDRVNVTSFQNPPILNTMGYVILANM